MALTLAFLGHFLYHAIRQFQYSKFFIICSICVENSFEFRIFNELKDDACVFVVCCDVGRKQQRVMLYVTEG